MVNLLPSQFRVGIIKIIVGGFSLMLASGIGWHWIVLNEQAQWETKLDALKEQATDSSDYQTVDYHSIVIEAHHSLSFFESLAKQGFFGVHLIRWIKMRGKIEWDGTAVSWDSLKAFANALKVYPPCASVKLPLIRNHENQWIEFHLKCGEGQDET